MKQKVLISGAGPAGLATALLLDKNKYDIKVVERAGDFNSMGFSIILWKSGFDILEKAIQKPADFVSPINDFKLLADKDFKPIHQMDSRNFAHSVERDTLIKHLSRAFIQQLGRKRITFNTFVHDINRVDDKMQVEFSHGKSEEFDLVICADGMHSDIRSKHFESKITSGPYKIVYQWIEPGSGLSNESIIGGMKDVLYLIQTTLDKALLAYYIDPEDDFGEEFESILTNAMNDRYDGDFKIDSSSRMIFAGEEVEVENLNKPGLVLIGDAAHGHPPTIAMGTSMALEDAELLSSLLNEAGMNTALETYNERRKKRLAAIYRTQSAIDNLFTHSEFKMKLSELAFMAGGKYIFEHHMRHLIEIDEI